MLNNLFKNNENIIIDLINKLTPLKRKTKFDTRFCLDNICKILVSGIKWKDLQLKECHYSTIYKRFIFWSKSEVFKTIKELILEEYIKKQDLLTNRILYIDSTMVKNHYGKDIIGKNHYDRNRKATKMSIICDVNRVPLSTVYVKANIHDSSLIEETIESIKCKIRPNNKYCNILIGDKGYIVNKERRNNIRKKYNFKLITPSRKNQIIKNSIKEKKLLKNRYIIENVFCRLDKFKRIRYREERCIEQFKAFNDIAITIIIFENI